MILSSTAETIEAHNEAEKFLYFRTGANRELMPKYECNSLINDGHRIRLLHN
jgi:hypothetical protein